MKPYSYQIAIGQDEKLTFTPWGEDTDALITHIADLKACPRRIVKILSCKDLVTKEVCIFHPPKR